MAASVAPTTTRVTAAASNWACRSARTTRSRARSTIASTSIARVNYNRPTHPTLATTEPWTGTREHTWSVALEDTLQFTSQLSAVLGVSYDKNELKEATDYTVALGVFNYPTGDSDAVNAQAAVYWRYNDAAQLHASISSRSRFPTIFERFSTRFGNAVPNPDLDAERGLNYEIGWDSGTTVGQHDAVRDACSTTTSAT